MAFGSEKDQTPDVRKLQLQIAGLYNIVNGVGGLVSTVNSQGQSINGLINTQVNAPAAPVGNLLWNGEMGHSAHTWHDTTDPAAQADKNEECAWWYSHQTPANAATFTDTEIDTIAGNLTLPAHGMTTGLLVNLLANTNGGTGGILPAEWAAIAAAAFIIVVDPGVVRLAASMADAFAGTQVIPSTTGTNGSDPFGIEPLLLATYTTATVGSEDNQELKTIAHTTYFPQFSRWDSANGWGELTGTTTIDQPLPMNFIDATVGLARVSLIAAKANQYIEIPDAALMAMGIFDNTSEQRKFLEGSIGLAASFNGTPTPGGDERQFRVLLTSDRGYQLLSETVTVYNTPTTLDSTHNITLSWAQQAGQLQVDIYEYYVPSTEYRLIAQVSAATSFIYQGTVLSIQPNGYPSSTGDIRNATYFTQTLDMADLATNGVSPFWDTVGAPIEVPDNYNKGVTTDRQWLRIWMTQAPNLLINDVITDGSATITLPDGAINSAAFASGGYGSGSAPYTTGAAGQSMYVDLVAQVYDVDDVLLATTSVDTVTSNTSIDLATTITAGANRKIRIVGAGFHGIYIDKVHLGFQQNTSYAPNALDVRSLQPLAAPSSSTQGGVGTGGSGGGIIRCIAEGTPVQLDKGMWAPVEDSRPGYLWASGGVRPNMLAKLKPGFGVVRKVRAANGASVCCTDTEKFMVSRLDVDGVRLISLRVGDLVLTEVDGRLEMSPLVEIGPYLGPVKIYSPTVTGNRLFVAGRVEPSRWRWPAWLTRRHPRVGGFVLHNKEEGGGGGIVT